MSCIFKVSISNAMKHAMSTVHSEDLVLFFLFSLRLALCRTELNSHVNIFIQSKANKRSGHALPYLPIGRATTSHAPLNLSLVQMTTLPCRHGSSHLASAHTFESLGHLGLGVVLGVATLEIRDKSTEGPAFERQLRCLVDLISDRFAPLFPVVAIVCAYLKRRQMVAKFYCQ